MATTKTNQQYSINWSDLARGLLIAVLTAVFTTVLDQIQTLGLTLDWKEIGVIALTAGISYVLKNFLTPTEIVVVNPPADAVADVKKGASVEVSGKTIAPAKQTA